VIVENRTGAGGSIATERITSSPADGYSLLVLTSSATALPALRGAKLPYDMERDLAPITLMASGPWVVVAHPSVPANNIKELIAIARAQPGKLNYGSSGVAGATHLGGEYFNQLAKVKITHVPYKGGAESAIATATGQVDLTYSTIPSVQPLLEARKLKPLAVTSIKRSAAMPSVPTIAESALPGFDYTIWVGVLARAGTPGEIVARLNKVIAQIVSTPDMTSALGKLGLDARVSTPEQFAALIRREIAQNAKLVKSIGVEPE
jgi:tripartite-type tricarboxylate transporter receptor subunit TctC